MYSKSAKYFHFSLILLRKIECCHLRTHLQYMMHISCSTEKEKLLSYTLTKVTICKYLENMVLYDCILF